MTKIKFNQLEKHSDFTIQKQKIGRQKYPSTRYIPKKPLKLLKINELQLSHNQQIHYILLIEDIFLQKYVLQLYGENYGHDLIASIGLEPDIMDSLIMEYEFII